MNFIYSEFQLNAADSSEFHAKPSHSSLNYIVYFFFTEYGNFSYAQITLKNIKQVKIFLLIKVIFFYFKV